MAKAKVPDIDAPIKLSAEDRAFLKRVRASRPGPYETTKTTIPGLEKQARKLGDSPVLPILMMLIGGYLVWFAVRYWGTGGWPTTPIKSVLTGNPIPPKTAQPGVTTAQLDADVATAGGNTTYIQAANQNNQTGAAGGNAGAPTATAADNQATGQLVAAAYNWSQAQNSHEWDALVKLWNQESGWNNQATNSQSGAYGIAQALGHGNANTVGAKLADGSQHNEYGGYGISDSMAQAANSGDPAAQITWGLQYIKETYGDPIAAWQHEVNNNWY